MFQVSLIVFQGLYGVRVSNCCARFIVSFGERFCLGSGGIIAKWYALIRFGWFILVLPCCWRCWHLLFLYLIKTTSICSLVQQWHFQNAGQEMTWFVAFLVLRYVPEVSWLWIRWIRWLASVLLHSSWESRINDSFSGATETHLVAVTSFCLKLWSRHCFSCTNLDCLRRLRGTLPIMVDPFKCHRTPVLPCSATLSCQSVSFRF